MILALLEDAFVAKLATAFAGRVAKVDHKPDRLTAEELARMLTIAPGVYVAFLGLQRRARPEGTWMATFGIYLVAANASGERARRRGDAATIGAYEMVEIAVRALDNWAPAEAAGAVEVATAEQLQAEAFERAARTVMALSTEVAVELPQGFTAADIAALAPFVTFDAAWDIPPHGNVAPPPPPPPDSGAGRRDAGDRITLPQS
jgi:phage gp37-like protein